MTNVLGIDTKAAIVDALLSAWGSAPHATHPRAADFGAAPLSGLAIYCGEASRPRTAGEPLASVVNRGMGTGDFGDVVAKAAQTFATQRYQLAAAHLSFVDTIAADNFKPIDVADISVATALRHVAENAEIQTGRITTQHATTASLLSYAGDLVFSREIVVNDQSALVATALTAFGNSAAVTEGRLVYSALEANAAMSDGAPVFHADFGNMTGALDAANLAAGMAALRGGMTGHDDDVSDLSAAHLIVASGLEYVARKLIRDAGLSISVTATAHLPAGHWYLLPDRKIQPVVSVLRLKGSVNPLRLEPFPKPVELDGFKIRAAADLGAVMVSRHAIRGQA